MTTTGLCMVLYPSDLKDRGHTLQVVGHHSDDLAETEGNNSEIITPHPKNGKTHQKPKKAATSPPIITAGKNGMLITDRGQMQGSIIKLISFSKGVSVNNEAV